MWTVALTCAIRRLTRSQRRRRSYDNNNRVVSYTSGLYSAEGQSYTYDHTSQLTEEDLGGYGGPFTVSGYSWDANGNPNGSSLSVPDGYGGSYYSAHEEKARGKGVRTI